jgi:hypothetical protein
VYCDLKFYVILWGFLIVKNLFVSINNSSWIGIVIWPPKNIPETLNLITRDFLEFQKLYFSHFPCPSQIFTTIPYMYCLFLHSICINWITNVFQFAKMHSENHEFLNVCQIRNLFLGVVCL